MQLVYIPVIINVVFVDETTSRYGEERNKGTALRSLSGKKEGRKTNSRTCTK